MRDFIITSLQTWDIEIGSTIKNTALEISKQNRVLYINTPMDISIRLRGNRQSPSYIRRMAVIMFLVIPADAMAQRPRRLRGA